MTMHAGENEQALRKILDMTRLIGIIILVLHFYYYCYAAFQQWGLVREFSDRILSNIYRTGIFSAFVKSKLIALGFLLISLLGVRGRKDSPDGFCLHHYRSAYLFIQLSFPFAEAGNHAGGCCLCGHDLHRLFVGPFRWNAAIPDHQEQAKQQRHFQYRK